jgi:uncharacterized membrane protein YqiK
MYKNVYTNTHTTSIKEMNGKGSRCSVNGKKYELEMILIRKLKLNLGVAVLKTTLNVI